MPHGTFHALLAMIGCAQTLAICSLAVLTQNRGALRDPMAFCLFAGSLTMPAAFILASVDSLTWQIGAWFIMTSVLMTVLPVATEKATRRLAGRYAGRHRRTDA